MFTFKDSLRLTVGTGDVAASGTFLAGITSINILDLHPSGLSFVSKELLKLEEVPFMQLFTLLFTKPYSLPDPRQILKGNYRSVIKRFYNLLCYRVVSISSEAVLLLRYFLKVSFSRFAATRLQNTSNLFVTPGNSFNLTAAKELIFRGNCNLLNPPVNADNIAGEFRIGNLLTENYIQKNFILSDKQVSGTSFPCKILSKTFRNRDRDFDSSFDSKQRKLVSFKPNIETSSIITNRTLLALWAGRLLFLFQFCFNGLNGFSSFHSGRYSKLGRKIFSCFKIGFVVQRNPIRIAVIPSYLTNKIKSLCVGVQRWFDAFYRDIKFKLYGSYKLHVHIISTLNIFVKRKSAKATRLKARVSASLLQETRQ